MRTTKNFIYNLLYQILTLVLPIILTPYISRVLHADGIGAFTVSAAMVNYFVLFGVIGTGSYGNREIAYVRDDDMRLRQTFWELVIIRFVTLGTSIALYVVFVLFTIPQEDHLLYSMQGVTLFATLFDISWYYVGTENFKKITIRNSLVKLVGVFLVFGLIKSPKDLWLYALCITGTTLLGNLSMWLVLPKQMLVFQIDPKKLTYHLKRTMKLWVPSLAAQVYASLDKVMLGYLTSNTQAGLYENSQKLVKMTTMIATALSSVLCPRLANLQSKGQTKEFMEVAEKGFVFVSFLAIPICGGIIAIRQTLVPWFYGPGFEEITNLLMLSAWLVITLAWSSILGSGILISLGKEKQYTVAIVCGAIINASLNFLFIRRFQAAGAILASCAAEYCGTMIMAYFCREYFQFSRVVKPLLRYGIAAIIMSSLCFYIGTFMTPSIAATFLQIIIGTIVYATLMLVFKDECMKIIMDKISGFLRKFRKG